MRNFICVALAVCAAAHLSAQTPEASPAVSTPATSAEVQALREEVLSLKELVQTLQQQVKAQQPATENVNPNPPVLPENSETPTAAASASPAASASAPPLFPTTDNAVVSSPSSPPVNANGTTTFPTTDESVTATNAPTTTTADNSSSLTQPIPILGGGNNKNYMNISFDSVFALAASSDRHLDRIEVGDHDPQQRGFNARNA